MIRTEKNVVMKYCEVLDRFVRVRVFQDEETPRLLKGVKITDRNSYRHAVILACVVEYANEILGNSEYPGDPEWREEVEEHLYALVIDLNPQLDIRKVTVPAGTPSEGADARAKTQTQDSENPLDADEVKDAVRNLEKILAKRIIGQDEAVAVVASAVKRAWVGIVDPRRPIGCFLFAGQTGVGKTELCKVLAEALYGDEDQLVRIDCSEYSLPHEYAKLIGAPPGYVGHENNGFLAEEMARVGDGVVLFDEVEKADEKVHNLLLQIMDEGMVTDNKGNRIRFNGSIVICTSNLGVEEISSHIRRAGFGIDTERAATHEERRRATCEAIDKEFRPEFVNRLDEVVVFRMLGEKSCLRIVDLLLKDLTLRADGRDLRLRFTAGVRRQVVCTGFRPEYGARELRRTVKRIIETPLAQRILDGDLPEKGKIDVRVRGGNIAFQSVAHRRSRRGQLPLSRRV